MSTTTVSNVERIEKLIARSETTTAFLQVQRLEALIAEGERTGAITIDGYPASHAQIALNIQVDHYRDLCRKNNLPIHI
jgi:hypothetical protein